MKFKLQVTFFILSLLFAISMMGLAVPAYASQVEETPTEVPTETATELPTEVPTETPTEIPTEVPTETPVVTETPPTVVPTEPTVIVTLPPATETPVPAFDEGSEARSCAWAWDRIQFATFPDEGYRFFDNPNHYWCQTWLLREFGVDYEAYKALDQ